MATSISAHQTWKREYKQSSRKRIYFGLVGVIHQCPAVRRYNQRYIQRGQSFDRGGMPDHPEARSKQDLASADELGVRIFKEH